MSIVQAFGHVFTHSVTELQRAAAKTSKPGFERLMKVASESGSPTVSAECTFLIEALTTIGLVGAPSVVDDLRKEAFAASLIPSVSSSWTGDVVRKAGVAATFIGACCAVLLLILAMFPLHTIILLSLVTF